MEDLVVVVCPSCSQKYRVPTARVGTRAACKKCKQHFRIAIDQPIDDDTIVGWVNEDDPSSHSVLGSTAIFNAPLPRQAGAARSKSIWKHPPPPSKPRVQFDEMDEKETRFSFPAVTLLEPDLRTSFPHKCAECLTRTDLYIRYLLWTDKLLPEDAAALRAAEARQERRLSETLLRYGDRWLTNLRPIRELPRPLCEPFPYFVCGECAGDDAVACQLTARNEMLRCRLMIRNAAVALSFFRNNGGRGQPGYQKLLVASRREMDRHWHGLDETVRARLGKWLTLQPGEAFLGYYASADVSPLEAGSIGLVLTDRRVVYSERGNCTEIDLAQGGTLSIRADRFAADVHLAPRENHGVRLRLTPLIASSLARALSSLTHPWTINVATTPEPQS